LASDALNKDRQNGTFVILSLPKDLSPTGNRRFLGKLGMTEASFLQSLMAAEASGL
jgi:hypothetical protein